MNPNLKVILIRGLPGSGKSTLAENLCKNRGWESTWWEADQFFANLGYFDPKLLPDAHKYCFLGFEQDVKLYSEAIFNGVVIVSNTFTQKWEMQPYLDVCKKYGIEPQIIVCKGNFKSIHNVPEATIEKMRQRWED